MPLGFSTFSKGPHSDYIDPNCCVVRLIVCMIWMCIDLLVKYSFMNLWGPLERSCCYHTLASGSLQYNKGFSFLVSWIIRIDSSEFEALNFSVTFSSHVFSNTTVGDRLYEKIEIKLIYSLNVFLLNRSCVWRGRKKDHAATVQTLLSQLFAMKQICNNMCSKDIRELQ